MKKNKYENWNKDKYKKIEKIQYYECFGFDISKVNVLISRKKKVFNVTLSNSFTSKLDSLGDEKSYLTFTATLHDYVKITSFKFKSDYSDCHSFDADLKIHETYNDLCDEIV